MVCPSAEASRMDDPLGEDASTVLQESLILIHAERGEPAWPVFRIRSTEATNGGPPRRRASPPESSRWRPPRTARSRDRVLMEVSGCSAFRSNTLMMCARSQPTSSLFPSKVCGHRRRLGAGAQGGDLGVIGPVEHQHLVVVLAQHVILHARVVRQEIDQRPRGCSRWFRAGWAAARSPAR